ncbi:unnamed protein product [Tetraodon nigroviridis]|uniref:Chromosome undetermined SCAF14595, whole genome shotgun sequence n=1 Tax=Tetraodon nigroviridis TaxID=99883 RepID=Q4SGG3_TETNG|nr:unnamed protein product [Tetraodon nigroviridis]
MSRWVWCPLLLLLLPLLLRQVRTQEDNPVTFLPGRPQNVTVGANETVRAVLSAVPVDVAFVTLQFHAQDHNATLSYTRTPRPGYFLSAVDAGLLSSLQPDQTSLSWFLSSPDGTPVTGTALVLAYSSADPVPGACNMEFNLDTDPNGSALSGLRRIDSRRHPLAGLHKLLPLPAGPDPVVGRPEHGGVQLHPRPGRRLLRGGQRPPAEHLGRLRARPHLRLQFASTLDNCRTLGKVSTKVLFTLTGLAGLLVCFFGHRFFKCELFCMGFTFAAFFFFVLITRTSDLDYDLRLVLSALIGVVGGVVLLMSWWRFGSVMACVVVVGLMLGFLLASVVLFTPLGDLDVFRRSDAVFWLTFCCIMVVVPLFFVRWPREGNILTCGVVGAYAVVLAVNAYVYTSLSYITLNILKRFLNTNFSTAFTDVPFQTIDFAMITVWVVLGVGGVVLQLHRERQRPFFPPSPYLMWQQERERRQTNVLDPSHHFPSLPNRLLARLQQLTRRREPAGEHTPLLL